MTANRQKNPPYDEQHTLRTGHFMEQLVEATDRGFETGALVPIPTSSIEYEEAGLSFQIRKIEALKRKEAAKAIQVASKEIPRPPRNPFLPYEKDLFVADLSETHVAVLNKFRVIAHHFLILTRDFERQTSALTLTDIWAATLCLQQLDGLVFYNGGEAAGASQPHKHLQMIPFPLTETAAFPMQRVWRDGDLQDSRLQDLPFVHAFARLSLDTERETKVCAELLFETYLSLMQRVGLSLEEEEVSPYNLLLSRGGMMVVPRRQEFCEGISVNALGFAGALLGRDQQQVEHIRDIGAIRLLTEVGYTEL